MTSRPARLKIPDIKYVRHITGLLAKLDIIQCQRQVPDYAASYDSNGNFIGSRPIMKTLYGWGLKESKDYVESKYQYLDINDPVRQIEVGNIISQIKALRKHNSVLNKLDIKSTDYGLKACKEAVERLRARR